MSQNIKKTALALAVMAASALSAQSAFAVTVTNVAPPGASTLPTLVADVDVQNATTVVALGATDINISNTDLIIGRTTGFSVRIDLGGSATFSALAAPTVGTALTVGTAWTVTLAAGGVGSNYAVYSVQPVAGSSGVINGNALAWAAGGIKVTNVAGLATAGGTAAATVTFADPNTAAVILTPVTVNVLQSADALAYSVAPSSNLLKKIDVGSAVVASKTGYSSDGTLNKSPSEAFFEAGTPTVGVAAGVLNAITGAPFAWAAGDTLNLTVTGTFNAFTQTGASVNLVTAGTCALPTASIVGTVTSSQVTFSGVPYSSLNAGTGILCFTVPAANAQVIDATSIATSAVVTRTATGKTNSGSGNGLAMAYNGPVDVVYTFNPAGNTTQQSFLRISNTGGTSGLVTITGKDDMGAAAPGTVSMTLASGKSIQLTSDDLQNGNAAKGLTGALGAGTGKWILTVTGQISGMEVTNLNRNNTSGTVSNLGTPVDGGH
ncbi:MAG: hypothetical protein KGJ97_12540 [Xanthomonadaceae bacterium]|jgi:hypothetical protein|nr:hypothetical protein [Xanthomonadaceae bacterium]